MLLEWFGHSCFRLSSDEGSAVFDPYAPGSVPGLSLPPLTADAVFCSHDHADHSYAAAVRLSGDVPRFRCRQEATFHDECCGKKRGKNLVTVIEAEGMRIVHAGDIGHTLSPQSVSEIGCADVLMVPVGGFYTVDACDAYAIARQLEARIVIPMHWRGSGFGYDVLAGVEDYVAEAGGAHYFNGSSLVIDKDTPAMTAVLRCPAEK